LPPRLNTCAAQNPAYIHHTGFELACSMSNKQAAHRHLHKACMPPTPLRLCLVGPQEFDTMVPCPFPPIHSCPPVSL
jgi:hypothetical protein